MKEEKKGTKKTKNNQPKRIQAYPRRIPRREDPRLRQEMIEPQRKPELVAKKTNPMETVATNNNNTILFVLIFIIGFGIGYCVYKYSHPQSTPKNEKPTTEETEITNKSTVDLASLQDFIESYQLDYYDYSTSNITDFNKLDNQRKLNAAANWVIYSVQHADNSYDQTRYDFTRGVKQEVLEQYIEDTLGKNVSLKHEDIKNLVGNQEVFIKYNPENGSYLWALDTTPNMYPIQSVYDKIVDYDGSKVEVTVRKVFSIQPESGTYTQFYATYDEALKNFRNKTQLDPLFTVDQLPAVSDNCPRNTYRQYIDENYSTLKSRMTKVTYTFKKQDTNYILAKYTVK